jgi:hypothetical protein
MTLQEWCLELQVLIEDLQRKEMVPLIGLGGEYFLQQPPDQLKPSSTQFASSCTLAAPTPLQISLTLNLMTLQDWCLKLQVLIEDLQWKEMVLQLVGPGGEYFRQKPPDQLFPSSPQFAP